MDTYHEASDPTDASGDCDEQAVKKCEIACSRTITAMKTVVKIFGMLLPVAAIIMIILQVVVSNELASLGKKLGNIEYEISNQNDMRELLSAEVASASSLLALREKAESLGFAEPSNRQIMHISLEVPVAFGIGNKNTPSELQ